jgi:hypothetical protein
MDFFSFLKVQKKKKKKKKKKKRIFWKATILKQHEYQLENKNKIAIGFKSN